MAAPVRIAKLMSQRGMCSRREAERLIAAGSVVVDGEVVREQGTKADPGADIRIEGPGANWMARKVTVVLNKPVGVVSTQPEGDQVPAWTLLTAERFAGEIDPAAQRVIDQPFYLNVAGRLDRDSRGLLVLSHDGLVVRRITAGDGVLKVYRVTLDRLPDDEQLRRLQGRLVLDGKPLRPMAVSRAGRQALRFELTEGRKHQLRRACRLVGLEVTDLRRVQVGPWQLGDLKEGHWRLATPDELRAL